MMTSSFLQLGCLLLLAHFALLRTNLHMHEPCFFVRSLFHFNYEKAKRTP
jgi:hypothetical protein